MEQGRPWCDEMNSDCILADLEVGVAYLVEHKGSN